MSIIQAEAIGGAVTVTQTSATTWDVTRNSTGQSIGRIEKEGNYINALFGGRTSIRANSLEHAAKIIGYRNLNPDMNGPLE